MKNPFIKLLILINIIIFLISFGLSAANTKTNSDHIFKRRPINYTIILDLSDRVLNENQLNYDIAQIKQLFSDFKNKAKQNLIITSKDRFVLKIIPQKRSTLNLDFYENTIQLRLDQLNIREKNKKLEELESNLITTLGQLKKEAILGKNTNDYAGVDLWSFINDNKDSLTSPGYENTIVIMTDGYLDFENSNHVVELKNHFTGTKFLKELNSDNWKEKAIQEDYGILPINLNFDAKWIITGLKSKNKSDLFQLSKIKYFWNKWIEESANTKPYFINYSTESQILSQLNTIINQ